MHPRRGLWGVLNAALHVGGEERPPRAASSGPRRPRGVLRVLRAPLSRGSRLRTCGGCATTRAPHHPRAPRGTVYPLSYIMNTLTRPAARCFHNIDL